MDKKQRNKEIAKMWRQMLWLYAVAGTQITASVVAAGCMMGELQKDSHLSAIVCAAIFAYFLFDGLDAIEDAGKIKTKLFQTRSKSAQRRGR